jgi:DNA-binding NtrC family response regulator
VTAYSGPTTALEAEEAGVWQVLPKPVDPPRLLKLVDEALDQPLILIVDDDESLCANLWDLFRERSYRVCVAHGLQAAAQQLPQRDFQVALIDLRLPDGSGTEVHDLVRKACPKARTVLITAFVSELDRVVQRLLEEGADAACYKPFDVPKLLDTIRNLVQTDLPLAPAREEV